MTGIDALALARTNETADDDKTGVVKVIGAGGERQEFIRRADVHPGGVEFALVDLIDILDKVLFRREDMPGVVKQVAVVILRVTVGNIDGVDLEVVVLIERIKLNDGIFLEAVHAAVGLQFCEHLVVAAHGVGIDGTVLFQILDTVKVAQERAPVNSILLIEVVAEIECVVLGLHDREVDVETGDLHPSHQVLILGVEGGEFDLHTLREVHIGVLLVDLRPVGLLVRVQHF